MSRTATAVMHGMIELDMSLKDISDFQITHHIHTWSVIMVIKLGKTSYNMHTAQLNSYSSSFQFKNNGV